MRFRLHQAVVAATTLASAVRARLPHGPCAEPHEPDPATDGLALTPLQSRIETP